MKTGVESEAVVNSSPFGSVTLSDIPRGLLALSEEAGVLPPTPKRPTTG